MDGSSGGAPHREADRNPPRGRRCATVGAGAIVLLLILGGVHWESPPSGSLRGLRAFNVPALHLDSFVAVPSVIELGTSTLLSANVSSGAPPYSYLYSGLPPGCTSPDLPSLDCFPISAGSWSVELRVTDSAGSVVGGGLTLLVTGRPVITGAAAVPASIAVGGSTELWTGVAGGVGPYAFVYAALPPGCATANQSVLVCTPTGIGNYTPTVTVRDRLGGTATALLPLTVLADPVPVSTARPLVLTTFDLTPDVIPLGASFTLVARAGGGAPPYAFEYSGLPSNCPPLSATVLTCAPESSGTYPIGVVLTDSNGTRVFAAATLTVQPGPPSANGTAKPPTWSDADVVGAAVLFALAGAGGGAALAWLIRSRD